MTEPLRVIFTYLYQLPCSFLRDKLLFGGIHRAFEKQNTHFASVQNKFILSGIPPGNLKTIVIQHNSKFNFNLAMLRMTLLLTLFLTLVGAGQGQTVTLLPDGDVSTGNWTATPLWNKINTAGGSYISHPNVSNSIAVFSIQNPSNTGNYLKVSIKFRVSQNAAQAGSPQLYSNIRINGEAIEEKLVSDDLGTSFSDYTVEWDNLSYSQIQMNSLQVEIRPDNLNPNRLPRVGFIEVTLTYEEQQVCQDATLTLISGSTGQSLCEGTAIADIIYTYGGGATGATVSNLPAGLTHIVNPGTKTVTISGTPTSSGTYTVSTTGENQCEEVSLSGTITLNPVPDKPSVVAITQPDCGTPTGSVVLSGLPSGRWLLTQQPGSTTIPGSGTNTTISGLSSETYSYTVINLCPGSGSGLTAEYFNNMTLSGTPAMTRTDATVNFDWGNGGPGSPIVVNNFSVRWSGKILPCFSENYTFTTRSDDGIRLWVNGTRIINNWTNHASAYNQGSISLNAGQLYDIVLEYYENTGQAVAELYWESNSQSYGIIPQTLLFPAGTPAVVCSSPPTEDIVINVKPATPYISTHPSTTGQNLCIGEDAATISVTATGDGLTYQWYSNTNNSNTGGTLIDEATDASYSPSSLSAGTLYFYCVVTGDCGTVTSNVSGAITVHELPTANISGDASICEGDFTTITIDFTGTGPWEITTQRNGGEDLTVTNIDVNPYAFQVSETGVYTLTALSDANCTGATLGSASVTVEPPPVAGTLNKSPDEANVCTGTDVSATLTAGAGGNGIDELEYRTNDGTDWTDWATYNSETDISTTGLAGVEIRTRRLADYCNHSDCNNVSWAVYPLPDINLTSSSAALCHGELVAYLSFSTSTGNTYSIDFDATAIGKGFADVTGGSLTGSEIEIIVPGSAQPDTYSAELTVTNSTTGCTSEVYNITITIHPLPATGEIIPD